MILSDSQIHNRIERGEIVFEPEIDEEVQLQPASVDLLLGTSFCTFRPDAYACIDPSDKDQLAQLTKAHTLEPGQFFILHPGHFALATTVEYVKVPTDLVGRVEGRSSLGRLGVMVHVTAGFIDPGFEGHITLELANVGPLPVKLAPGSRICQITFLPTVGVKRPYGAKRGSKYQHQRGPTASMGV